MTPRIHRRLAVLAAAVLSTAASLHAEQYVRYEHDGAVSWGRLDGSTIHQLDGAPYAGGSATGTTVAANDARLLAPVSPSKVFAVGLNYRSHLGNAEPAKEPPIFLKLPTSIVGHEQPIVLPAGSENVHYEAELVLVVGKRLKNATPEEAEGAIFGVTCGNDVSGRNWQRADLQWFRAKASDTFGPGRPGRGHRRRSGRSDPASAATTARLSRNRRPATSCSVRPPSSPSSATTPRSRPAT